MKHKTISERFDERFSTDMFEEDSDFLMAYPKVSEIKQFITNTLEEIAGEIEDSEGYIECGCGQKFETNEALDIIRKHL